VSEFRVYLSPPDVGSLEKKFVADALDSGWAAPAGADLDAFEVEVADHCGRAHGVGLASGTAALHLALVALGVRSGDLVICSAMTFVATANAISYVGAVPVFVDSAPETGNISVPLLEKALAAVSSSGRNIGAVLPVDFLGKVADYSAIVSLCEKYGVPVLADAAESLGAFHQGRPAGSFGAASIVSFNGNKIATTSGGGMVLTDDETVAKRVRFLATQAREPVVHYEHRELGYNYRLSNVLAALGRAQVQRLPEMIERRRENRRKYREMFRGVDGVEVFGGNDDEDNCWLSSVIVSEELPWRAAELSEFLEEMNIESRPLWKPMHLQPLYKGCEAYVDGSSERLFRTSVTLPSGSNLSDAQWERIESAIEDFLRSKA
jgi:dTDP-4-amino-4,6-dideoxygalactose transaminase